MEAGQPGFAYLQFSLATFSLPNGTSLIPILPGSRRKNSVFFIPRQGNHALYYNDQVLAVPETAVIDTGSQTIVYREILQGEYEGVKIELGPRMVGPDGVTYFPVLRALEAGTGNTELKTISRVEMATARRHWARWQRSYHS